MGTTRSSLVWSSSDCMYAYTQGYVLNDSWIITGSSFLAYPDDDSRGVTRAGMRQSALVEWSLAMHRTRSLTGSSSSTYLRSISPLSASACFPTSLDFGSVRMVVVVVVAIYM